MSLTVQQLLTDAKRLSGRLRDHDASADNVISNAQEVLKAVDAMRQYQEDIDNLNSIAHNRPRAQLVLGIQQENRHIRQLQHENKELRAALEEHQNAIELIMSKYRQHITSLVHSSKLDNNAINEQKSRLLQDRADKICEMASVMNQSIQIDEERYSQERELMSRLVTENKGLREMLEISARNGSRSDPLIGPKVTSRGSQTDDLMQDVLILPSKMTTRNTKCAMNDKDLLDDQVSNKLSSKMDTISIGEKTLDGRQDVSLSGTKDESSGSSKDTTSPAASYTSSAAVSIGANLPTSKNTVYVSNSSTSGTLLSPSNDCKTEESCSPSRPISAASDSSESSTESSTTSEEDEEQEVAFNTIKRRQTMINVISPKSTSSPHVEKNVSSNLKVSNLPNAASDNAEENCDDTTCIINSNGDNFATLKDTNSVNDSLIGDVNDNMENGVNKKTDVSPEITKINGDNHDIIRTPSVIRNDSGLKGDDKSSKKETKNSKSTSSPNALVNSLDEHQTSLPGINLPARFKKGNSKAKKSTIRKSDLRNNGCGSSDSDKKVSK